MTSADTAPPSSSRRDRFVKALAVFLKPRVLIILFLGFASGLPLALSGSTLALRMADQGVDLSTIGLFSLAGLPYTIKFLWAPIVDATRVPVLSRLLGRRRGWLILSQLLLMAAILYLGWLDPTLVPWAVALGAVLVAIASATQDIVIDAFRVESLPDEEQAAGMAWFVSAYRVGMLASTAGAALLVSALQLRGFDLADAWGWAYAGMAGLVLIGMVTTLLATEPDRDTATGAEHVGEVHDRRANPVMRVAVTAYAAFHEFLTRKDAVAILLFVVLYKFCDAFAGVMTAPFVLDIGFSKAAYAGIVKGVGFAAVLVGGFAGGAMAKAMPMVRALWIAGLLQMASNVVFSWQAMVGPELWALSVTIAVENFTGGLGTVVFVAYISSLCTDARHTATQYALLAALAAVGRTVLAATAGYAAEAIGWVFFFGLTALAAIPGLALLWWLARRGHFRPVPDTAAIRD
ncbi:AmpG family muropeptide MFS transporter [Amorphus orientalis]|uniref:PAT family beta-lactamase induction signal transducer AmpG n=1 Tax=Amorphus orientalis TaxID=649198 RepID=A0AAE4AU38_9HYPH|nr:MFS transporter [Amorphus orientalis]MDQ0316963.1 PAT family beta-lactamase induction signal transducer AmpG [Amorphus orientalis]